MSKMGNLEWAKKQLRKAEQSRTNAVYQDGIRRDQLDALDAKVKRWEYIVELCGRDEPVKVKFGGYCPSCGNVVKAEQNEGFCDECGQRIYRME